MQFTHISDCDFVPLSWFWRVDLGTLNTPAAFDWYWICLFLYVCMAIYIQFSWDRGILNGGGGIKSHWIMLDGGARENCRLGCGLH